MNVKLIFRKVEEVDLEYTDAFVRLTDHAYTQRQLLRTEALVLRVLQFNLTMPSPLTFIKLMCVLNKIQSKKTMHLAMVSFEICYCEQKVRRNRYNISILHLLFQMNFIAFKITETIRNNLSDSGFHWNIRILLNIFKNDYW